MKRTWILAALVAAMAMGLAAEGRAQAVQTEAQYTALRWPTRTMREVLPAKLAKVDAGYHTKVADVTALKAIPSTDRTDGMLVVVKAGADGLAHGYMFHSTSTATNDNDLVVAANAGGGRWLRLDAAAAAVGIPPITSPIASGIPLMTADGKLATSIYAPDDFATATQGGKADSALQSGDVTPATLADGADSAFTVPVVVHKSFPAGGGGAPDDVTIYAANTLPFPVVCPLWTVTITAGNDVGRTVKVFTQAAGAGDELLSADASAVDTLDSFGAGPPAVPGTLIGLFLRRSDSAIAGRALLFCVKVAGD